MSLPTAISTPLVPQSPMPRMASASETTMRSMSRPPEALASAHSTQSGSSTER